MTDRRSTGVLLIAFAVLSLVAAGVLATAFDWPGVLGEPAAVALPAFDAARSAVIAGFMLQTLLSVALVPIALGLHVEHGGLWARTVTAFGVLSGLTQTLGWIRWPIVIPGLADTWLDPATSPVLRIATEASYELVHGYAGGALGEYLGWVFQAAWAVGIAVLLVRAAVVGRGAAAAGLGLAVVWALSFLGGPFVAALGDGLFATVGFSAYAAWFIWLGFVGLRLLGPTRTPAGAR